MSPSGPSNLVSEWSVSPRAYGKFLCDVFDSWHRRDAGRNACDDYVYPEYRLGNIMETPIGEMAWSEPAAAFGRDKRDRLTARCRACEFRFACNGGCPKHRFLRSKDGEPGHNYFCESYAMFFRHAGERLRIVGARMTY